MFWQFWSYLLSVTTSSTLICHDANGSLVKSSVKRVPGLNPVTDLSGNDIWYI